MRPAGHYVSRCAVPADLLNEGRYVVGVNASSYRIRRYFQDEQALTFNVDAAGAPGMQWLELRLACCDRRVLDHGRCMDRECAIRAGEATGSQTSARRNPIRGRTLLAAAPNRKPIGKSFSLRT